MPGGPLLFPWLLWSCKEEQVHAGHLLHSHPGNVHRDGGWRVLGYSGNLENTIRNPLKDALSKYRDDVNEPTDPLYAYKTAWNEVQHEVSIEITSLVLTNISS